MGRGLDGKEIVIWLLGVSCLSEKVNNGLELVSGKQEQWQQQQVQCSGLCPCSSTMSQRARRAFPLNSSPGFLRSMWTCAKSTSKALFSRCYLHWSGCFLWSETCVCVCVCIGCIFHDAVITLWTFSMGGKMALPDKDHQPLRPPGSCPLGWGSGHSWCTLLSSRRKWDE